MEAQSCGIPVVATAVGGNPEIVTVDNGLLLSPTPTPEEIASAIEAFLNNLDWRRKKGIASRKNWERRFSASKNLTVFASWLAGSIRDSGRIPRERPSNDYNH